MGYLGAIACVALLAGCAPARVSPTPTTSAAAIDVAPSPSVTVPPRVTPIAVLIGDSIMAGAGLSKDDAWPALVGDTRKWEVHNLGCSGGGFMVYGDCGTRFDGLIEKAADLKPTFVIVQATSNDFGQDPDERAARTLATFQKLREALPDTTIIGMSVVWSDSETDLPRDDTDEVNDDVKSAVDAIDGTYVDVGTPLFGHPEWMQEDYIHPTEPGQKAISDAVLAALSAAKIRF